MEKWRSIEGFPKYMVSDRGRVYSHITHKYLKPRKHPEGYLTVALTENGKCHNKLIHRLVAQAFLTKGGENFVVNHKDENRSNNAACNLEWISFADNLKYSTAKCGMSHKCKAGQSGEPYIHIIKNGYRFNVRRYNFVRGASFPTLAEAVAYRKEVLGA